jgi:hypothetical protein
LWGWQSAAGIWHGHTLKIWFRDADTWKISMDFVTTPHLPQ